MTQRFTSPRVTLIEGRHPLLAMASVIVGEALMVTQIRIVEGRSGIFVSMPQRKAADGSYADVVWAVNKETREEMSAVLIREYERLAIGEPMRVSR